MKLILLIPLISIVGLVLFVLIQFSLFNTFPQDHPYVKWWEKHITSRQDYEDNW